MRRYKVRCKACCTRGALLLSSHLLHLPLPLRLNLVLLMGRNACWRDGFHQPETFWLTAMVCPRRGRG